MHMTSEASILISLPDNTGSMPAYTTELLTERLEILVDDKVSTVPDGTPGLTVQLKFDPSLMRKLGSEGYRIRTEKGEVTISSAGGNGLMYGVSRFIEWVMAETIPGLPDKQNVDIDFPVERGQAAAFLKNLPKKVIEEKPYYPIRGMELTNLALGVADLIDTPKGVEKYNFYSDILDGFKGSADVWKKWCDWCARHRMNFVTNWPYSAGTNWWELANDPATSGMSIYTEEEIEKAAAVREELFQYARSRGIVPYLMNYVPGAPTDTIRRNRPDIIGKRWNPSYPTPFNLSPKTTEVFVAQMRAIMRKYPSLGGLHLRWWGESFLDPSYGLRPQEDLTITMMNAAKAERPDFSILMSGFFRMGGTPQFAARFPKGSIIQSKWGADWEPFPEPNVPFDKIREVKHPFIISQCLPGEEYHSIGGVQYRSLEQGIKKYVANSKKVPNLKGFSTVTGEMDHEWITETNYIAMSHLNWAPAKTDVAILVKNYLYTHYGPKAVEPTFRAMELTQDAMELYLRDFAGLSPYIDCARIHGVFGFSRIDGLHPKEVEPGLAEVSVEAGPLKEAVSLLESVESEVKPAGRKSFQDILIQTRFYAGLLESRVTMARAFLDRKNGNVDGMVEKLTRLKQMDQHLVDLAMSKPNISDDFEFEDMRQAILTEKYANREIEGIDKLLAPESIAEMRRTREIYGNVSIMDVIGDIGLKKTITFPALSDSRKIKSIHLLFIVRDIDGEKSGDEAVVKFLGREIALNPTGDSQRKAYSFRIDPDTLLQSPFSVDFVLAGKPGTMGYYVDLCKLKVVFEE